MDKAIASKTSSAFSPNSDLFMPVLLEFMNGIINQKISMKWSADKCKYSKSKSSGDLTKESRSPKSDQQFSLYKSYIIWHFWFESIVCFSTQIADKLLWVKLWHFKWRNDPRSTKINGLFPRLPTCVLTQTALLCLSWMPDGAEIYCDIMKTNRQILLNFTASLWLQNIHRETLNEANLFFQESPQCHTANFS